MLYRGEKKSSTRTTDYHLPEALIICRDIYRQSDQWSLQFRASHLLLSLRAQIVAELISLHQATGKMALNWLLLKLSVTLCTLYAVGWMFNPTCSSNASAYSWENEWLRWGKRVYGNSPPKRINWIRFLDNFYLYLFSWRTSLWLISYPISVILNVPSPSCCAQRSS